MTQDGWNYRRQGQGAPLLLLHGTGSCLAAWRLTLPLLAAHRDVIAVDLPGHGGSALPPAGAAADPENFARMLCGLLDQLGLDQVEVAGNSIGGWTALELARLGRVRRLTLLSPAGLWPRGAPLFCRVSLVLTRLMAGLASPFVPLAARSSLGRILLMAQVVGRPAGMSAADVIEAVRGMARAPGFWRHLTDSWNKCFQHWSDITVPVTIGWGDRDWLILPTARGLDSLPSQVRVTVLPGCGHVPMYDDPQAVADLILAV